MPHIIETKAFYFKELDDKAKEKAREWWRHDGFDYNWWDCVEQDFVEILSILGFSDIKMYFSGFWSQGDGACFDSSYKYAPGWRKKLRAHLGGDSLQFFERIGETLQDMQRPHMYSLIGGTVQRGRYYHEYCMLCELEHPDDFRQVDEIQFTETCREVARWLYRSLETEYNAINSDENVDNSIIVNEYEFDEFGNTL